MRCVFMNIHDMDGARTVSWVEALDDLRLRARSGVVIDLDSEVRIDGDPNGADTAASE
jgi:hypothetical protein